MYTLGQKKILIKKNENQFTIALNCPSLLKLLKIDFFFFLGALIIQFNRSNLNLSNFCDLLIRLDYKMKNSVLFYWFMDPRVQIQHKVI